MYIIVTKKSPFRKIKCFTCEDSETFWKLYEALVDRIDLNKSNITVAHCPVDQLPSWLANNVKLTFVEYMSAKILGRIWVDEFKVSLNF